MKRSLTAPKLSLEQNLKQRKHMKLKLGDKVMVKDNWIDADYMVMEGTIVSIGYYENSTSPLVVLIQFDNHKSHWFSTIAIKRE